MAPSAPEQPAFFLFAEDDDDDFLMLEEAILDAGIANQYARVLDGQELLEWLRAPRNPRPTALLLDINMSPMNGLDALDQIRADPALADLEVVVLTTSTSDRQRCEDRGVFNYYVKPGTQAELLRILSDVLGLKWILASS